MFSEFELDKLRREIRTYMSEYRYKHTLGVERAAIELGNVFLPKSLPELRVAALLHDITKELSLDEQMKLIDFSDLSITDEDRRTLPALHSFSAVPFIKEHFAHFATENVLSAVAHHTLGAENISLFDKIIFLADYIEDGRVHDSCIRTAQYVKSNLSLGRALSENTEVLNKAIIMAVDFTVAAVKSKNSTPHSRTVIMRSGLCGKN